MEGKWLTWMLRHLWVEGNEVKAVKLYEWEKNVKSTF
jgi:hypothetical protein